MKRDINDNYIRKNKSYIISSLFIFLFFINFNFISADAFDLDNVTYIRNISVPSASLDTSGICLSPDGLNMIILQANSDSVLTKYNLSIAWNISSAVIDTNKSLNGVVLEFQNMRTLFCNRNNSYIYSVNSFASSNIYQMITPVSDWNVSGIYQEKTEPTDDNPHGLYFSSNGTYMYINGRSGNVLKQYRLTTPYEINTIASTIATVNQFKGVGIFFSPDGTRLYNMNDTTSRLVMYNLTSAWDISSLVFLSQVDLTSFDTIMNGFFIKPDGTQLYIVGNQNDKIYQFNLFTPVVVSLNVTLISPINNSVVLVSPSEQENITYNGIITCSTGNNNDCDMEFSGINSVWLYINNVQYQENISGEYGNYSFIQNLSVGNYTWKFVIEKGSAEIQNSTTRNLYIQQSQPQPTEQNIFGLIFGSLFSGAIPLWIGIMLSVIIIYFIYIGIVKKDSNQEDFAI